MNVRSLVEADRMSVVAGIKQAQRDGAALRVLMENCTPAERVVYEVALAGNVQAVEDGKRYLRGMP